MSLSPSQLPMQYGAIPSGHKPHPKSKFTPEEDKLLRALVNQYGESNWSKIAENMPRRNVRQCKERWQNYLTPNVSKEPWTPEEDLLLEEKYNEIGAKWVRIAQFFKNRTDTNVKNRYMVLSRRSKKEAMHSNIQPSRQQIQMQVTNAIQQQQFQESYKIQIPPIITPPINPQMMQQQIPLPVNSPQRSDNVMPVPPKLCSYIQANQAQFR